MNILLMLIATVFIDESPQKEDSLILSINDKTIFFEIVSSELKHHSKIKHLKIELSENINTWIVFDNKFDGVRNPSFNLKTEVDSLPDAICKLDHLESLSIAFLGIKQLPDDFSSLQSLQYLDISFNKFNLDQELFKLKDLQKLKQLNVFGCGINQQQIDRILESNPNLRINYTKDHFLNRTWR